MSRLRSTVFLLAITGIICLGIGYFVGAITARIRSGWDSQLAAIRVHVDNLAALNQSSAGFERATLLSARADLLTFVCEKYEHLNAQQKAETQSYVARYNSFANGGYTLPAIKDGADKEKTRLEYCSLMKSNSA
ncbi:MAG TPA: hypothetical protein VFP88_02625 [Rhodanobacteraceae bacterium]|nr:hypothetical protein [Rhodanobacteraceae bacterium]